jgi:cobalt/nickel transport system ATP-binding protein
MPRASAGRGNGRYMTEYAVKITRLSYSYPDGVKALEGIDLDVPAGERIAIIGPGGSGKSTLLLHLNGTLSGSGTVRIMGQALAGGDIRAIRRQVGLVFQDPHDQLFCPTVFEDVAFGPLSLGIPAGEVQHRVGRTLHEVGLDLSFLLRPSHHLSLGECKCVAIASVLAMEPPILALDEPGSNLGPRVRKRIIGVLGKLPATLILATHDLEMVLALCARTVLMARGRIVADRETQQLLSDRQLMEEHGLEVPAGLQRSG